MSDEIIGLKINLDNGNAEQSVKSLKAQIKEANNELINMADKFGQGSNAAKEAAKRVAELRDKIGDARSMADAFNPDAKFNSLSQAISGAAGAFSAYQGALGALGMSTEAAEKQMVKLQSAMALSQGLSSFLDDGIQGFKNLYNVVGDVASKAFGSLRNAMITTGIGALVVAVGVLVANFDELSVAIGWSTRESQLLSEVNDKVNESLKGVYTSIQNVQQGFNDYHSGLKSKAEALKIYNDELGDNLGYATSVEQAEKLFIERTKALVQAATLRATAQALLNQQVENNVKLDALQRGDNDQLSMWQKLGAGFYAAGGVAVAALSAGISGNYDVTKSYAERTAYLRRETIKQLQDTNIELDNAVTEINKKADLIEKATGVKAIESKREDRPTPARPTPTTRPTPARPTPTTQKKKPTAPGVKPTAVDIDALDPDSPDYFQSNAQMAAIDQLELREIDYAAAHKERMKGVLSEEKRIQAERVELQQFYLDTTSNILNSMSDLAGRNSKAGKAFAISSTLIDTYVAAQKAYTSQFNPVSDASSPIRGALAATAAIASGLARVKAIVAVNASGTNSGGGSAPNAPSIPRANTTTTLNKGTIDKLGDNSAKAYVLETDIANNQKRIERINIITKFK